VHALGELPEGQKLTAKELAKRAGWAYDDAFRTDLAALVRLGRVVNHNPGYNSGFVVFTVASTWASDDSCLEMPRSARVGSGILHWFPNGTGDL
jgi:hypothetical protein